ncbi:MAG: T9SS type A sorting domain-containing protein [Flavobacteriales bacterium]|nr:T9SS type A sorting domain-containing protein [Flavobacteriales bacterium]
MADPTSVQTVKRILLAASIAMTAQCGTAQSWCTPGATWTYEAGLFLAGFIRMSYTHDTVVAGHTAQIIDRYSAIQYPQPPPGPTYGGPPVVGYTPIAVIARFEEDVVYTLGGGVWDTLYWFAAVPGDRWHPAHVNDTTCQPLIVTDTSTIIVDGLPLRRLEVSGNTVIERIGSTWDMFLYCPNWILDGPTGMRCYSDDDISFQLVPGACEQFVGIDEQAGIQVHAYPTPGNDRFTLRLPTGTHLLHVCDLAGHSVFTGRVSNGIPIDASAWPTGNYLLRLPELGHALKWMKE